MSTATRAQQTWQLASAELAAAPPVRDEDRAYAASARALLDLVRELPTHVGTVVLVGHNPGLEELAAALTDEWVQLPTSALAVLDLPGAWESAGSSGAALRASGRPPGEPAT